MTLRPLTYADYRRLAPYFDRQTHRLCVYCLPSIIAWQSSYYRPMYVERDGRLVVAAEFDRQRANRHLLLPVGPPPPPPPEALHRLALSLGFDCYWFVPEDYVTAHGTAALERHFSVAEQGGFHDYVYRRRDLADLAGGRYHKKRNLVRQFTRQYVQTGRTAVAPIRPADVDACIVFLEEWCARRECGVEDPEDDLTCEKIAAVNAITHLAEVDAEGLLVRVDGVVSALAVAAPLTEDMGVLMFEKAFSDVKGLYQYLDRTCARQLFEGKRFVNKESDMGVPGLVQAKRSYHPVAMVKSYRLDVK